MVEVGFEHKFIPIEQQQINAKKGHKEIEKKCNYWTNYVRLSNQILNWKTYKYKGIRGTLIDKVHTKSKANPRSKKKTNPNISN